MADILTRWRPMMKIIKQSILLVLLVGSFTTHTVLGMKKVSAKKEEFQAKNGTPKLIQISDKEILTDHEKQQQFFANMIENDQPFTFEIDHEINQNYKSSFVQFFSLLLNKLMRNNKLNLFTGLNLIVPIEDNMLNEDQFLISLLLIPNLQTLHIINIDSDTSYRPITQKNYDLLTQIANNLREVHFENVWVNDYTFIEKLYNLEILTIKQSYRITKDLLSTIGELTNLQYLNLDKSNFNFSDNDTINPESIITTLCKLPKLMYANLSTQSFDITHIKELLSKCPNLKGLYVKSLQIPPCLSKSETFTSPQDLIKKRDLMENIQDTITQLKKNNMIFFTTDSKEYTMEEIDAQHLFEIKAARNQKNKKNK